MPALLSTVPIRRLSVVTLFAAASWSLAACAGDTTGEHATAGRAAPATAVAGTALTMRDTVIDATIEASGVAEPALRATLSTKLMGTVTAVLVHEGDRVRAGQPLVRIDARDLTAKSAQVGASMADAEAMQRDAARHSAPIPVFSATCGR
jgi:multidrug efflux pump subunit AcrA (membrane-fusion protein)